MRHPIDELFEKYPALKAGAKPLGILETLDRKTYRDEVEFLETPGLPLAEQFSIVDSLSKLNHQSGYTAAVLNHLGSLIKHLPHDSQKPLKILDIGVGGGGLLRALHHWTKRKKINAELWGLDISQNFIQRAKKHLDAEKISVQFIHTDACKMQGVADNQFDVVLSNYMVHHIRCISKVGDFLSEVHRVGKSWLIVDLQRKIMGPLMMQVATVPFFPPRVLLEDGIKSIRRAYRAKEMNMILSELQKEGRVRHMRATPLALLPYWMIKGHK